MDSSLIILLTAVVTSSLWMAINGWRLLCRVKLHPIWQYLTLLLPMISISCSLFELQAFAQEQSDAFSAPWMRVVGAVSIAGTCWLGALLFQHYWPVTSRKSLLLWLTASILLFGWSYRQYKFLESNLANFGLGAMPGSIVPSNSNAGFTDLGRPVELYQFVGNAQSSDYIQNSNSRYVHYGNSMIVRESATTQANCHGWVFTSGQFLLKSEGVQRILEDHQYEQTESPVVGDIVIYRICENGEIRHTGLVQAVLTDGTVLIESKWGIDQRFLHLPESQPYSNYFEYYHTDRANHCIRMENQQASDDDA